MPLSRHLGNLDTSFFTRPRLLPICSQYCSRARVHPLTVSIGIVCSGVLSDRVRSLESNLNATMQTVAELLNTQAGGVERSREDVTPHVSPAPSERGEIDGGGDAVGEDVDDAPPAAIPSHAMSSFAEDLMQTDTAGETTAGETSDGVTTDDDTEGERHVSPADDVREDLVSPRPLPTVPEVDVSLADDTPTENTDNDATSNTDVGAITADDEDDEKERNEEDGMTDAPVSPDDGGETVDEAEQDRVVTASPTDEAGEKEEEDDRAQTRTLARDDANDENQSVVDGDASAVEEPLPEVEVGHTNDDTNEEVEAQIAAGELCIPFKAPPSSRHPRAQSSTHSIHSIVPRTPLSVSELPKL
jgi:hypothetical protein